MTNYKEAIQLWNKLGDISINDDGEIDEVFITPHLTFEKGTDREDIWHWFEEHFTGFMAARAMYGGYDEDGNEVANWRG